MTTDNNWWGDDNRIRELANLLAPYGGRPIEVEGTTARVGYQAPDAADSACEYIFRAWASKYGIV